MRKTHIKYCNQTNKVDSSSDKLLRRVLGLKQDLHIGYEEKE